MYDLISRQVAIDGLGGHRVERIRLNDWQVGWNDALDWVQDIYLKGLPPAEPKWISVEQKLPDNDNTVLITHRGGVSFGWYNGRYWERGASTNHRKLQTVTAWMPLPEPYKGESGEQSI